MSMCRDAHMREYINVCVCACVRVCVRACVYLGCRICGLIVLREQLDDVTFLEAVGRAEVSVFAQGLQLFHGLLHVPIGGDQGTRGGVCMCVSMGGLGLGRGRGFAHEGGWACVRLLVDGFVFTPVLILLPLPLALIEVHVLF